jgi:hypothetical protein
MIAAIENGDSDDYVIKNGRLYREISDDVLLVVPKTMQMQIIRDAHKRGHFGVNKTEAIIGSRECVPRLSVLYQIA